MQNPLQSLLDLAEEEKDARGLRHTPFEISQQPRSWQSTYQRCHQQRAQLQAFTKESGIVSNHRPAPEVFLVGAGTSDYIGRALADLLRQRWACPVWAIPSTDLLTNMESLLVPGHEHFWISFSRSGDSSEGVAVLQRALSTYPRIRHLVVTCNSSGRMAQLCSEKPDQALALVLDEAVNDQGLAMTSSFSNMVVAGQCLAHLEEMEGYREILDCMVTMGSKFMRDAADVAAAIAAMNCAKACFLGAGPLAAVASESALKLLELTAGRIHTMWESVLGFRHGPMSALNRDSLCTLFLSNDPRRQPYEIDLLREIRAKGLAGVTVAVTPQRSAQLESLTDRLISLDAPPDFKDEYRPPLDVMFAQLLGLFSSVHAGLHPDRPSPNGAINRVVSHLRVYP